MEFKTIDLNMIKERELPDTGIYVHELVLKIRMKRGNQSQSLRELIDAFNRAYRYTKCVKSCGLATPPIQSAQPHAQWSSGMPMNCRYPVQPQMPVLREVGTNQVDGYTYKEDDYLQLYFIQIGEEAPDLTFLPDWLLKFEIEDEHLLQRSYPIETPQSELGDQCHGLCLYLNELFQQEQQWREFVGFKQDLITYQPLLEKLSLKFELYQTYKNEFIQQYLRLTHPINGCTVYYSGGTEYHPEEGLCSEIIALAEEGFMTELQEAHERLNQIQRGLGGSFEFYQLADFQ